MQTLYIKVLYNIYKILSFKDIGGFLEVIKAINRDVSVVKYLTSWFPILLMVKTVDCLLYRLSTTESYNMTHIQCYR